MDHANPGHEGKAGYKQMLKFVILGMILLVFIWLLTIVLRQPSHDRDWRAEIAVMPKIAIEGDVYAIDQVRDWTYSREDITSEAYRAGQYNIEDLQGAWLLVEPFESNDAIAHTLVIFEFKDETLLALTIEARKEVGEVYSAIKGAFNTFELVYLWAEARDVLTRRATYLDHDVFVYPLSLTEEQRRTFFGALVSKTNKLSETPRFYNTLFSNCTNELAKTAGLSWNVAFMLTGKAPDHLFKVGTIAGKEEGIVFEDLKQAAHVTDLVQSIDGAEKAGFDRDFLGALKLRFKGVQSQVSR